MPIALLYTYFQPPPPKSREILTVFWFGMLNFVQLLSFFTVKASIGQSSRLFKRSILG